MVKLGELRDQSYKILAKWKDISNLMNVALKYKCLSEYYVVAEEFHKLKFWFMADLRFIK